jgi:hypothetical protein
VGKRRGSGGGVRVRLIIKEIGMVVIVIGVDNGGDARGTSPNPGLSYPSVSNGFHPSFVGCIMANA